MTGDAHDDELHSAHGQHGDPFGQPRADFAVPEGAFFAAVGALCKTAVRLTGADGAAVAALMSSRSRELVHATDATARRIDELQFAIGAGPCLEAHASQWPQLCPRLDAEGPRQRWLPFSAGVQELGVQAVFAFPVLAAQQSLGVLELYRRAPGALDDAQLGHASHCADVIGRIILAAVPRAGSPAETKLVAEAALLHANNPFNRSEVYVASGVVAVQLDVSADEALARIRAHAFAEGVSIASAVADIVAGRLSLHA
jgi:hypothetical protein